MGCAGPGRTIPCPLEGGRRLLGYFSAGDHFLTALVAYQEEKPTDFQFFNVPAGIVHFAPIDANTVALLEGASAKIHLLNLANGQVTGELQPPASTKWLIGP